MFYVIRRGVKEAMEARADVVILDMKTPGGDLDSTLKIIDVLEQFPGLTVTYVDNEAISAGAFIAYGTREIYMSERAVIRSFCPDYGWTCRPDRRRRYPKRSSKGGLDDPGSNACLRRALWA